MRTAWLAVRPTGWLWGWVYRGGGCDSDGLGQDPLPGRMVRIQIRRNPHVQVHSQDMEGNCQGGGRTSPFQGKPSTLLHRGAPIRSLPNGFPPSTTITPIKYTS